MNSYNKYSDPQGNLNFNLQGSTSKKQTKEELEIELKGWEKDTTRGSDVSRDLAQTMVNSIKRILKRDF